MTHKRGRRNKAMNRAARQAKAEAELRVPSASRREVRGADSLRQPSAMEGDSVQGIGFGMDESALLEYTNNTTVQHDTPMVTSIDRTHVLLSNENVNEPPPSNQEGDVRSSIDDVIDHTYMWSNIDEHPPSNQEVNVISPFVNGTRVLSSDKSINESPPIIQESNTGPHVRSSIPNLSATGDDVGLLATRSGISNTPFDHRAPRYSTNLNTMAMDRMKWTWTNKTWGQMTMD